MVSCTEFIPMYSELFKFIDGKGGGHDAVERYWIWVGEKYLRYNLEPLVQEKGMDGAWEYWTRSLSEEACDIKYVYDRDHEEIKSHMRHCPSKGHLLEYTWMEPYYDYCGHCKVLYRQTLEDAGIREEYDHSGVDHAECRGCLYKIANGGPRPGWNTI
ncbi:MAG: hypothetical protein IIY46_07820 [Lachnospiraceae bacterium]|nr:hypothetical protein [Lachnospiraceae bacterium]